MAAARGIPATGGRRCCSDRLCAGRRPQVSHPRQRAHCWRAPRGVPAIVAHCHSQIHPWQPQYVRTGCTSPRLPKQRCPRQPRTRASGDAASDCESFPGVLLSSMISSSTLGVRASSCPLSERLPVVERPPPAEPGRGFDGPCLWALCTTGMDFSDPFPIGTMQLSL